MFPRRALRRAFGVLLVLSLLTVGVGYVTAATETRFESHLDESGVTTDEPIVPPRDNVTVVATDSNSWRGATSDGPRARAELVAFAPDGSVMYYNDSHTRYWDVDPVPGTAATVEYAYADHLDSADCPPVDAADHGVSAERWEEYTDVHGDVPACTRNGYERVNLSTGEVTPVWSRVTPGKEATRYHDIDRLNETHVVVADIFLDRVFVVDTESGETTWSWNASDHLDTETTGGPYPADWTHINDVEVLADGRITVSARNNDRVFFLNESGVVENWTLGEEDDYGTLHEQHNPDYIPEERGGPAVLVADSENNRIVEYQRENGEWNRSWLWRDAQAQWPRDADRLPNGHTLVADSNGNRVFEVDRQGDIVWSANIAFPYEVERLGTGDESAGGPSAAAANIQTRRPGAVGQVIIAMKQVVPSKYLNGLMYVTPVWVGIVEVYALAMGLAVAFVWGMLELWWRLAPQFRGSDGTDAESPRSSNRE